MINSHSKNKIINRMAAAINKSIKAHAYYMTCTSFKVKSKAQYIAGIIAGKIKLPSWLAKTHMSKQQKSDAAHDYWAIKYNARIRNGGADFKFVSPKKFYGYGALLEAAEQLGEFTWSELMHSIPHHAERIKTAYANWGKRRDCKASMQYYANNYLNSYRAYFVKNRIIAKVKGKRGTYTLTRNGRTLLSGMKQLDTMY